MNHDDTFSDNPKHMHTNWKVAIGLLNECVRVAYLSFWQRFVHTGRATSRCRIPGKRKSRAKGKARHVHPLTDDAVK